MDFNNLPPHFGRLSPGPLVEFVERHRDYERHLDREAAGATFKNTETASHQSNMLRMRDLYAEINGAPVDEPETAAVVSPPTMYVHNDMLILPPRW